MEEAIAERIYDRVSARVACEAEANDAHCRIDPGFVDARRANRLLGLHHRCDHTRCRPRLRALHALAPNLFVCPAPHCLVSESDISVALADLRATKSVLGAVKEAFYTQRQGAEQAMVAAIAEYAKARRSRDKLFLQALPSDGTIPAIMISRFQIERPDLYRLLPTLGADTRRQAPPKRGAQQ
ncbi:hypothetical protein ACFU44_22925 [Nocardia rhizosphaerihabitans]|uniref:hypothetical protein n=1 Tax=Nocardia rhizosphaerihabitans TaxID=1691570 RepID=UPI0036735829